MFTILDMIRANVLCLCSILSATLPALPQADECLSSLPEGPAKIARDVEDRVVREGVACLVASEDASREFCDRAIRQEHNYYRRLLTARCCGQLHPDWCKDVALGHDVSAQTGCLEELGVLGADLGEGYEQAALNRAAMGWATVREAYSSRFVVAMLQFPELRHALYPWDIEFICQRHTGDHRVLDLLNSNSDSLSGLKKAVCVPEAEIWLKRSAWVMDLWVKCKESISFLEWACNDARTRRAVSNSKLWLVIGIEGCEELRMTGNELSAHELCAKWAETKVDEIQSLWTGRGDRTFDRERGVNGESPSDESEEASN